MKLKLILALTSAALLCGCASSNAPKADPIEGFNRATFAFNDALDNAVLKPVARGYQKVTPAPLRAGISNGFTNVGDVATSANNLLQGKPVSALSDIGRFLINSTLGVLGLFDVATPMGLTKNDEDFGQTLGRWGVGSGPYLVLPLMGPGTLRDVVGRVADRPLGWNRQVDHIRSRNVASGVEIIDLRANLLEASNTLDEAALDRYQFLRDAYLQRRLSRVHDGKVPKQAREKLDDDLDPGGAAPAAAKKADK